MPITASMLYNLVQCSHRVALDQHADPMDRDEINPFVQLLWEKGTQHEADIVARLTDTFVDLSAYAGDEKAARTAEAMAARAPLIYSGRIQADDLLGDPDLLRLEGDRYVAGDIKSGAGEEGPEDLSKPKKHYAVQVALYTDILERLGLSAGRQAYIIDIHGEEVTYVLEEPQGVRNPTTMWEWYEAALEDARRIVATANATRPAMASICKLCHWYTACGRALEEVDDLTLLPELGRARRDSIAVELPTVAALADAEIDDFILGKKTRFAGVGPDMLRKFQARAQLVRSRHPQPYLSRPVTLPDSDVELFFDIEVDPMRDVCYLHGFVERRGRDDSTERYVSFFADEATVDGEREAFARAFEYVAEREEAAIYYYAPYERTWWRNLQKRHPAICSEEDVERIFGRDTTVDLYTNVVKSSTEWPTRDHSIKTLAKFLGFNWRDAHPSGAASIQWFDEWVRERQPEMRQRILDYNEDDCVATRWLVDGIRRL